MKAENEMEDVLVGPAGSRRGVVVVVVVVRCSGCGCGCGCGCRCGCRCLVCREFEL